MYLPCSFTHSDVWFQCAVFIENCFWRIFRYSRHCKLVAVEDGNIFAVISRSEPRKFCSKSNCHPSSDRGDRGRFVDHDVLIEVSAASAVHNGGQARHTGHVSTNFQPWLWSAYEHNAGDSRI